MGDTGDTGESKAQEPSDSATTIFGKAVKLGSLSKFSGETSKFDSWRHYVDREGHGFKSSLEPPTVKKLSNRDWFPTVISHEPKPRRVW